MHDYYRKATNKALVYANREKFGSLEENDTPRSNASFIDRSHMELFNANNINLNNNNNTTDLPPPSIVDYANEIMKDSPGKHEPGYAA